MITRPAIVLCASLAFFSACASRPPERIAPVQAVVAVKDAAAPARGPLLVTLVIDELAAWIVDERMAALPSTGGFARLAREGTYAKDVRHSYAVTETAPGHAVLYTGAPPRESGIFGNEVLDPSGHEVSILKDPATKLVSSEGPEDAASSSIAALAVDTLADSFRAAHAFAVILSLSLKDRGAIFGGGRKPTASIWYDPKRGRFVTSTAFANALPVWVTEASGPDRMKTELARTWEPLDPAFLRAHVKTPDAQDGEGDLAGLGITFPHALGKSTDPALAFRATPFADEVLVRLALLGLDANRTAAPTLLAVSLSSNDYVGHIFGPDSWEAWDELLRLDGLLGRFFAALDERFGERGWSAMLSADHGVVSLPEVTSPDVRTWCKTPLVADRWRRPCGKGGRLLLEDLSKELKAVAKKTLGPGEWIVGVVEPSVQLTPAARALDEARRTKLVAALSKALLAHPEIDRVVDVRTSPATCPALPDESIEALVCRAISPGRSGDLFVLTKPGSIFDTTYVVGKGANHGSAYVYDRAIPLLVRAPGRVAAGRTIDEPMGSGAFAKTAATLLGVELPLTRDARDLTRP